MCIISLVSVVVIIVFKKKFLVKRMVLRFEVGLEVVVDIDKGFVFLVMVFCVVYVLFVKMVGCFEEVFDMLIGVGVLVLEEVLLFFVVIVLFFLVFE